MNFSNLRISGCKQDHPLENIHKKIILEDKHNVIEVIIGNYNKDGMNYVVAGHNCHVGEFSVAINPNPENGVYMNERYAIISMLCYLHETYGKQWPAEVVKIIELAVWENRQFSLFD